MSSACASTRATRAAPCGPAMAGSWEMAKETRTLEACTASTSTSSLGRPSVVAVAERMWSSSSRETEPSETVTASSVVWSMMVHSTRTCTPGGGGGEGRGEGGGAGTGGLGGREGGPGGGEGHATQSVARSVYSPSASPKPVTCTYHALSKPTSAPPAAAGTDTATRAFSPHPPSSSKATWTPPWPGHPSQTRITVSRAEPHKSSTTEPPTCTRYQCAPEPI
mmetsp:Transcript_6671/g.19526  ORF Transcript_6671/g.19526 Transcript_6671/m.19526 type:complete len:222 (+) Transcript_6671:907-1572(+)